MRTVLITTSGIGSRLGNITKNINKSLIRIGDKFAISYIIEKYDLNNTRFVITLGYYGYLVKEFLEIAYKNAYFEFVTVDNYDKPGSSLAYSLLQAKNVLQCPFTFYCCDSIVLDSIQYPEPSENMIYVSKSDDTNSYSSINVLNDKIIKFNYKGEINCDFVYTGVSHIANYNEYWKTLQSLYDLNTTNKELGDIELFNSLIQQNITFKYKILNKWYDTGNMKTYTNAINYFKCSYDILYKNDESICFFDNKVIKFFSDKKKNIDRVTRGKSLYPNTPLILDSTDHFFSMEKVEGNLLSKYYVHGEIYRLLEWSYKNLWVNKKVDDNCTLSCIKFYYNKTLDRINQLILIRNNNEINTINGISILPIKELIKEIDMEILSTDTFYQYHGDFILDNIIKTSDGYKLIDWRQDFDGNLYHGDMYYDLAKFRHNIIFNHYNIENNLFSIKYDTDSSVIIDLKCNYFLMKQLEDYDKFILEHNLDLKKIKILTAIIWINMSPLHDFNISQFLFYFGKYNIALELNNYVRP
jgi:NDP-sugar pyrophosphorylase family protein